MSTQSPKLKKALKESMYGYLEVSGGTLRTYDLFHAFRDALKLYAPNGFITKRNLGFFHVPNAAKYNDSHAFWNEERAVELTDDMFDALDSISPEGYYFGNSAGDGSCFGWWEHYEEDGSVEDYFTPRG